MLKLVKPSELICKCGYNSFKQALNGLYCNKCALYHPNDLNAAKDNSDDLMGNIVKLEEQFLKLRKLLKELENLVN